MPDELAGDSAAMADAVAAGPDLIPVGRDVRSQPRSRGRNRDYGNGHQISQRADVAGNYSPTLCPAEDRGPALIHRDAILRRALGRLGGARRTHPLRSAKEFMERSYSYLRCKAVSGLL